MRLARTLTVAVALALLAWPLAGGAAANHDGRSLDATPEMQSHQIGQNAAITATVSSLVLLGGVNVDFEIESGPGDTDGNTPRSPDRTCTVGLISSSCSVQYTANGVGTDVITAWIDHDGNDGTAEGDNDEGQNEGGQPGNQAEPDITDVVIVTWTFGPASKLDCDDPTGDDIAVAPAKGPNSSRTYTCKLTDAGGNPLAGVAIDGDNRGGANDPQEQLAPDYELCRTGPGGACKGTVHSLGQAGVAEICFWGDTDDDAQVDMLGDANDGGDCDGETVDEEEGGDITDAVQITWLADTTAPESRIARPKNTFKYYQQNLTQFEGTSFDRASGVGKVQIALRKRRTDGRCSSWTGSGFRIGSCSERLWLDADGNTTWAYAMPRLLDKSTKGHPTAYYVLLARAVDADGNVEKIFVTGRNRNVFEII